MLVVIISFNTLLRKHFML